MILNTNRVLLASLAMILTIAGCQSDSVNNAPVEAGSQAVQPLSAGTGGVVVDPVDVMSCAGTSGLLMPDEKLELDLLDSKAEYSDGAVLSPTVVSFKICDFDSTGNSFAPKVQVFGPDVNTTFMRLAQVKVSLADAGLPASTPNNARFKVFRYNDSTGSWMFHVSGRVSSSGSGGLGVAYSFARNGTYAISLASLIILPDSSWTVTNLITPVTGGTLNLLNSSLTVPPLAVVVPTVVTFTLRQEMPEGVPNALPRIYEFSPEGTNFLVPVTLNVDLTDAGFDGLTDQVISLYYFDPQNSTWTLQPNAIERTGTRLSVQLNHFSRYAFAR